MLTIISIIFVVEFVMKVIVMGFFIGPKSYLSDNWNILDFIIVFFSIMNWVMDMLGFEGIGFVRGFRALRALRPLRMVSKNEGKFNSLLTVFRHQIGCQLFTAIYTITFERTSHHFTIFARLRHFGSLNV